MPKHPLLYFFLSFLFACSPGTRESRTGSAVLLSDESCYEFLNTAILDDTTKDPREWPKLIAEVLPYSDDLTDWIKKQDTLLTKEDIRFMSAQVDTLHYLWDFKKIKKAVYMNNAIVDSIFATPADTTVKKEDAWEQFTSKYGHKGIHSFSRPLFNKDKNIVIIEHSGQGGWTLGSGDRYMLKRTDGHWKLIISDLLWIS